MSTIDYLSALESLDSSSNNNDAILVDNDSDDLIDLWQHGRRRRRSCRRPTSDNGGNNINFNMNNILMLPPPPPLSSRSRNHLTANARASNPVDDTHMDNMMNLAAAMRSSVAITHNNSTPSDVFHAHSQMFLRRWHGYDVDDHTTDGNTGHLTTTTTLLSTSPTAAIAAAAPAGVSNGEGIFASPTPTSPPSSSSSALVPYTTYTPSRTMGRIGEQRLVRSPYYDNSNHHHRHQQHRQYHPLYHRLWQQPQYHHHQFDLPLPPQLEQQRRQMEQLVAAAAEAEELAVLDATAVAAVAAEDEGLERLRRILTSIHRGNNNSNSSSSFSSSNSAQLSVYNGTTATLPCLGMDPMEYLAMGGVDANATDVAGGQNHGVAEETAREENGTIVNSTLSSSTLTAGGVSSDTYQDNSNASPLSIQEEVTTASSATAEEISSSVQATTAATATTTATVANNDMTPGVASAATSPIPRIGRPVRQAAMRGMERISAAIATHGMGEGASTTFRTTTLTTRLCARSTAASGGQRKRKKKATIIHRPTPTTNDDGSISPTLSSAEKVAVSSPICCICMDEPSHEELSSIDACKHPFCFSCIEQWADQENTCPLCKARFHKIDRVNPIIRKWKNMDGECGGKGEPLECNRDEERSSKRVRNRDQRSDVHSYSSLEGIFGALEANGTWPTHIAQLLFSGLGASSLVGDSSGGLGHGLRATRRFITAASTAHGHFYQSHTAAATGNDMVDLAHWYEPTGARRDDGASSFPGGSTFGHGRGQYHREGMRSSPATSPSNSTTTTTRTRDGIVDLGARGIAHPSSPAWRRSYPTGRGASNFSATATSTAATPPTHRNPSSPWSASASVSVTLGPGGFEGESSSTRTTAYQHSTAPAPSAIDTWGNHQFLTGEEEEEMLSTMSALSPSSYIRRLHRELEQGHGMHSQRQDRHYQVNSSRAEVTSSTSGSSPLSMYFDRLRRESERDSQWQDRLRRQYQSNASGRVATTAHPCHAAASADAPNFTTATMEPTFTGNPYNSLSATNFGVGASSVHRNRTHGNINRWNNAAAGRTVETALEIDDSDDDDVVEIIDVDSN